MYAGINLSCFFLGYLKSPGFRPTFSYFHWSASLLGFVWCLFLVGLVADWGMAVMVTMSFLSLYLYTKRQHAQKEWGDVGNALRYVVANGALKALASSQSTDFHAKNWRPQLLTIVDTDAFGNPSNLHVLELAAQLKHGGGGVQVVTSIMCRNTGVEKYETCELMAHSKSLLQNHMLLRGMEDSFAQVTATTSKRSQAVWSAVIHSGLGPLSPNAVLLAYQSLRNEKEEQEDYLKTLRGIMNLKRAIIMFKGSPSYPPSKEHHNTNKSTVSIDVWWVVHDGGLLLLLPYILSQNDIYENVRLRLFAVTSSATENPERLRECVIDHLRRARIRAAVQIVDLSDTTIAEDMREADMSVRTSQRQQQQHPTDSNTHHMTVGEVFSQHAYEVPYHAVVDGDVETGKGEIGFNHHEPGCPTNNESVDTESTSSYDTTERVRTAQAFNQALKTHSSRATLVVTNLPLIRSEHPPDDFFDYIDTMSDGIKHMVFVRGSGVEVITTYA